MAKIIQHGIVCRVPDHPLGYFAWPSVAPDAQGNLVVVASGLRNAHVDPFGKTTLHLSKDQGETWQETVIVNDGPIDDRDAGVTLLENGELLISWFTSDTRWYLEGQKRLPLTVRQTALEKIASWTDELVDAHLGGYVRTGTPEAGFTPPLEIGVTAPHGPIVRSDGSLFYLGKGYWGKDPLPAVQGCDYPEADHSYRRSGGDRLSSAPNNAQASRDNRRNWTYLGFVPLLGSVDHENLHEPHAIELKDGSLLGVIRVQHHGGMNDCPRFGMMKTFSADGGRTWTPVEDMGVYGSPPHLIRHPSGAIICVYGYRDLDHPNEPVGHGQRAILSYDEGKTWSEPIILRDDGPTLDLGYPASIVLPDGSIFTVYYQQAAAGEKTSILYTRWAL